MSDRTFDEYFECVLKNGSEAGLYLYYDLLAQISGELIDYRLRNGLTREALAKKLGISHTAVSEIESGDWNPDLKTLAMYVARLGGKIKLSLGLVSAQKEGASYGEL